MIEEEKTLPLMEVIGNTAHERIFLRVPGTKGGYIKVERRHLLEAYGYRSAPLCVCVSYENSIYIESVN